MTNPSSGHGLRRILGDVAGFATSQYILRFANLLKGFVVARVLGPAGNGLWQHFALIIEYVQFTHGGALEGLNKQLGRRIGEGDEVGARETRDSGLGITILAGGLAWLGLVAWVYFRWNEIPATDRWGLPIVGAIVLLDLVTNCYWAYLRAYGRIAVISSVAMVFALSNLVIGLALLPVLQVFGLLLAWLVTRLVTTTWLVRRSGFPLTPRLDMPRLRGLIATGFPIYLFNLTRLGLRNIDRVLVDSVLAHSELGIYALAVTIAGLVRYGADAVGFVIYPIFLRMYGETGDPKSLVEHLEKPTMFLSIFISMVLGFSYLVLHLPILWLLPEFVRSIEIFRLLTISTVFSCLAVLPGFYMMAIDRQNWLVPLGLATVAFNYFAGFYFIRAGWGLPGVAASMALGLGIYTTCVFLISGRFAYGSWNGALRWLLRSYAPIAYFASVVAALRWFGPRSPLGLWGETPRALLEGGVFLVVSLPVLIAFERRTHFLASLKARKVR
jgi:O-antigen/teichoic acid export membrane protein